MLGSAFGVALAATLAWFWFGHPSGGPGSIRVERLQSPAGDAQAGLFADGLAGDLAMMAQGRRSTLRIFDPGAGPSPRFVLDGHVRSVAGKLGAILELHLAGDGSIVWSTSFEEPLAAAVNMRRQAALKLANVLTCTVGDGDQEFKDIEVLRLFLAACEGIDYGTDAPDGSGSVRDLFRKVVDRAPNFARAWAELAVGDAIHVPSPSESPEAFAAGRKITEQDAARALALDPRQARAWVARSMVATRVVDWFQSEADLSRALALDPDERLALEDHGDNLGQIGRYRDVLAVRRRLVNSDPLTLSNWSNLAQVEGYSGDLNAARATLDQAEKRWPGQAEIGDERLYLEARIGDPATARRLLDDPTGRTPIDPARAEYLRLLIAARSDPKRAEEAAAYMLAHAGKDLPLRNAIQGLVDVGHVDQAFDLAESHVADIANERNQLDGVFRPYMARFLANPRFMPLAARLGLIDIWRRTGLWPDFCTGPGAPYDCKAEARKLLSKGA
jgi:tetratricopeptide (TPR) repeat protein